MPEIKDFDSVSSFAANQGIDLFGIIGRASAHLLISGYWQPSLDLFVYIVGKHVFPSELLRFV
jgi:hypothetical protein